MAMIEMKVSGLMMDPLTNTPIVILKSLAGDRILPIWVGPFEAQAIALKRENLVAPRPLTHDLVQSLLQALRGQIERVVISDLRENTFYATIHLNRDGEHHAVDSRPSDGIALALRAEAPIFVEPLVLERSKAGDSAAAESESEQPDLRNWLENADPPNKYLM